MPEAFGAALAVPGLPFLIAVYLAAGLVRGFTGFGTALIVMPVATRALPPVEALVVLTLADIATWGTLGPRAVRQADLPEVGILSAAAVLAAPLGVALLAVLDPIPIRWGIAGVASVTLIALLSGWRYHGTVTRPGLAGIGAAAGGLGGLTGLAGPPVMLFYLAGTAGAARVRANTILFLMVLDIGVLGTLLLRDMISGRALALSLLVAVPYVLALLIGQRLFTPTRERFYRWLAYAIIALSILAGLPLFDS
ncbi:hypothetical protein RGUI_0354 [Rhodovulum sp. P5]|uniref:sulfite exporter TauE/SafE family protein n=1 Tax=Rhodovulum sp. P5 TaxID=1564506 RepID=UPI0009C2D73B|nr:sulfite exporter TauE/SafE family protein [Rhodovulum sp. P5]ARE38495.1 hypothetical protein RGUI_0354 [Rhodovulum sp. P5]